MRRSAFMCGVVGLSVLSATTLVGQGPFAPAPGPLDLILQKLIAIEKAVAPPEPSEVTLRTGGLPVVLVDALEECTATNVSTRPIEVTQTLKTGNVVKESRTTTMAPSSSAVVTTRETTNVFRCEFTFTGFPDEIRGNITGKEPQGLAQVVLEAR